MAGLVFGKYEKIRRLAEGGMGEVWLARQQASVKGFDRLVILKALKNDLAREPGFVEQFLDEARVAATLNHPSIVALFEVGEWGGTYFIAMEYIAGDDLSRLWYAAAKRGVGLPFQVSVKIVHDAALALDHAHHARDVHGQALNIVHRDVSPQNIMVRADGVTKLVDFGIAKAANRVSITKTGTVKGKLQYMSPEQVRGEAVDGRSDEFSLGIVLWEMCTGKRLFKGESELATLNKILQLPIPTPSSLVPGFPLELERVILRMLERDRKRRYARCSEVARELRGYLDRAASHNGELAVADFVDDILGEELRARTADLTPMISDEGAALDGARLAAGDAGGRTEERPTHIPHSAQSPDARAVGELLREPTTLSGEDDVVGGYDPASYGPATQPVPAIFDDDDEDADRMPAPLPARVTRDERSSARGYPDDDDDAAVAGGAATVPIAALPPEDDDVGDVGDVDDASAYALPARSGATRWVLAGMLAVLVAAGAGFVAFDAMVLEGRTRARAAALLGVSAPAPLLDDAALFTTLRADRPQAVEASLRELLAVYEAATGRPRAEAAAFASMLTSARARQEAGRAFALSLVVDPASQAASEAASREARRLRVEAYKLASEARTLAGDLPEAFLAMASYQAERGAAVEAEADLGGLERTLAHSERSDAQSRRLQAEAEAQRALARASAAFAGRVHEDDAAPAAASDARDDERRRWAAWWLLVKRTQPTDGAAARAVVDGVTADEKDPRKVALDAWARALATSASPATAASSATPSAARRPGDDAGEAKVATKAPAGSSKVLEQSASSLLAAAKQAQADGKSFEAATLFRKALKQDARSVEAWMGSGWAYIDLEKGDAAVRSFRRAVSLPGAPPEAQFGLAEAYRFSGQKAQAIKAYERYLLLAPAGPDAAVAKNALEALQD